MPEITVASYNVHGGLDGWGRPFDVVEPCRQIDADVLVLQESWSPDVGRPLAHVLAAELGYTVIDMALARGRVLAPVSDAGSRWGPRVWERHSHGMRLNHGHARAASQRPAQRRTEGRRAERGAWGIAVLSRLPVLRSRTLDLGQLRSDPARRGAIIADLDAGGIRLTMVGTHFAHLTQGSPIHMRRLRRALGALAGNGHAEGGPSSSHPGRAPVPVEPIRTSPSPDDATPVPAVLAGDMNLWGPPLLALFPGWVRAVRGRTWPSWTWPVVQTDHILVTRAVRTVAGEVLRVGGSDHYPVKARLLIEGAEVLRARDERTG
jgi:endonuclease/exonuclease/phosphatase family metal-dependent hydrolase